MYFAQQSLNLKCYAIAVENNIPISKMLSLVKLAQFLLKDPKAFSGLKQDRTTANYKLNEGLVHFNHKSLVTKLKSKHLFIY